MHVRRLLGAAVTGLLVVPGVALLTAGTAAASTSTSLTTTVPAVLVVGGAAASFTATAHAPETNTGQMVQIRFTLSDPAGIAPADLSLAYETAPHSGVFTAIPLAADDSTTVSGVSGAFRLLPGATPTSFTVLASSSAHPGSVLTSHAQVVLPSGGSALGPRSTDSTVLAPAVPTTKVTTTYPATTDALGVASAYQTTIDNTGNVGCTPVYAVTISGGLNLTARNVELVLNGTSVTSSAPADQPFSATARGTSVTAGSTGSDHWTLRYVGASVDFGGTDSLSVTTKATCNTTATATGKVAVLRPTVTVKLPPTIVKGQPTRFSATVTNGTHSDYDTVRLAILGCDAPSTTADCPGDLRGGDVTLRAYSDTSHSFQTLPCQVQQGELLCDFPAAVSFAKGTTRTQAFRLKVAVSSSITHLTLGMVLATDENVLADGVDSATVTAAVQGRPNPPVSVVTPVTPVAAVGGVTTVATVTLPATGAVGLPQSLGTGAALLLAGLLLCAAGRRSRGERHSR